LHWLITSWSPAICYKLFFHRIDEPMQAMAELLRRGRAPAEIMARYRHQDLLGGQSSKPVQ
jgi:hypothetical protein